MAKDLRFNVEARQLLKTGVDALANAVRVTLGPKGRNAVIEKLTGAPTITNDGVTIAREIQLRDPFANMGAQLVKEVAMKTNGVAGDGTTTATVLAQALVHQGLLAVEQGANPMVLRRGIEDAVEAVVEELRAGARTVEGEAELQRVATLAANDPRIGKVIAAAMARVGQEGIVTVEESARLGMDVHFVDGLVWDHGYVSAYMATDTDRMETVFQDPYILLTNEKISQVQDLMPVLEKVRPTGSPLVVVAENMDGPALGMLVANNVHDTFRSVVVRAPGFGHRRLAQLNDVAAVVGGKVITGEAGLNLSGVTLEHLGRCSRITVTENETTIVGGAGTAEGVSRRIEQLKKEFERAQNEQDQDFLQERIARLSGSVAVIEVGAATGVELKEKQHRVEDSLAATRAAIDEGVVVGGGAALLRARRVLRTLDLDGDAAEGAAIVSRALVEPARWIVTNAGYEPQDVLTALADLPAEQGFDAATGRYVDLFEAGIIDPLKVTRSALQSAASIAALLLTTETLLVEEVLHNPGAIVDPEFGDLAEGMVRPSNIY